MEPKHDALMNLVRSEIWEYVEEICEKEMTALRSTEEIDTSKGSEEIKIEVIARKRAEEKVRKILGRIKAYGDGPVTNPLTRSMK